MRTSFAGGRGGCAERGRQWMWWCLRGQADRASCSSGGVGDGLGVVSVCMKTVRMMRQRQRGRGKEAERGEKERGQKEAPARSSMQTNGNSEHTHPSAGSCLRHDGHGGDRRVAGAVDRGVTSSGCQVFIRCGNKTGRYRRRGRCVSFVTWSWSAKGRRRRWRRTRCRNSQCPPTPTLPGLLSSFSLPSDRVSSSCVRGV